MSGTTKWWLVVLAATVIFGCRSEMAGEKLGKELKAEFSNRLVSETSPYLLQHAHNPVDWYAWGEEAFDAARTQDKPIMLSIGYSSCHWCHVMERESFEDVATAEILNDNFICIKVDREERPDIDAIYMSAVMAMTGSGGWPLNVFLTHDLKPFFGGTYFPPDNRRGGTPFKVVLTHISDAWKNRRSEISKAADELTAAVKSMNSSSGASAEIKREVAGAAVAMLYASFDREQGGFGGAPKFPQPSIISFLLRYYHGSGEERALQMVTGTLDKMQAGGIFDHLGGGFHRYAVDSKWLVPHFEKMLYDNALLAKVYLEAYQVTREESYARTARLILDYVLRDMLDPNGGFHAAEDADSEGVEGKYYVWSLTEIGDLLGDEAAGFAEFFGVSKSGNFEGQNILNIRNHDASPSAFDNARMKLLAARSRRERPGRDYKIIAAWNGLMISAFVKGYEVLGETEYLDAAIQASLFLRDTMTHGDILYRTYAKLEAGAPGFLDDYAFVGNAYLDLYEATGDLEWLAECSRLTGNMLDRFGDKEGGGLFFTSGRDSSVLVRRKDYIDNALPSGNSEAAMLLYRLGQVTADEDYVSEARRILDAAAGAVSAHPSAHINAISASLMLNSAPIEIVIIGRTGAADTDAMLSAVRKSYLPNATVIFADSSDSNFRQLQDKIPLLEEKAMKDGRATAYVCVSRACREPVTSLDALRDQLEELSGNTGDTNRR